jgi:acyl carrier protein
LLGEQAIQIVLALAPEPVEHPTGDTRLVEGLGYDSLRLMELTIALEEHFGLTVSADARRIETLDDVDALMASLSDGVQVPR